MRGRFLFEIRPDAFPMGFVSELELAVWSLYYEERNARRKHG